MIRKPLPTPTPSTLALCTNKYCLKELQHVKNHISYRGYGYCSVECKKEWPPIINKIQRDYAAPIEIIIRIALLLFRSKGRASEVLEINVTTLERLAERISKNRKKVATLTNSSCK